MCCELEWSVPPGVTAAGPRAAIKAAAPAGGAATLITWGLRPARLRAEGLQGGHAIQLRDGGHALGGEHAAALQLPVLVLLQQHRPHQAGDRRVVGEDAHNPGTALDFFIDPLQQVGAPDLFPVGLREVAERQHVLLGRVHERSGLGEALGQRGGQIVPAGLDLRCGFLGKHAAQGGRDHALVGHGDALQQVAGKVNTAALPDAALQLPADRLGEPAVGIGDHQLDATQAPLFEMGDELRPEGLGLAVAHLETQQLAAAIAIHSHRHHGGTGGDLLGLALTGH